MWKQIVIKIILCFIILESVLRIYDVASGYILSDDLFMLYNKDSWANVVHPILTYTNRRSFNGLLPFIEPGRKFTVETNAHGFRTHEFFPKLPNEYRLIVLGDSFTYGYNANQTSTYPSVLEQLLQKNISKKISVYSLGVAGYSTIQYSLLVDMYVDYLKPDMIIVSEDLSDFNEDAGSIGGYILDDDGAPIMPKEPITQTQPVQNAHFAIGQYGNLIAFADNYSYWMTKLLFGSSLFHHVYEIYYDLSGQLFYLKSLYITRKAQLHKYPIITYDSLIRRFGGDFSSHIPERLFDDLIPYDLPTARVKYGTTYRLLQHIRDQANKRQIPIYLATYPYPWMVSIQATIPYQISFFNAIYDFRKDKVPEDLMSEYAAKLNIPFIDAYPAFRSGLANLYGFYDPHFSEKGYSVFAHVLFNAISPSIRQTITAQ